MVCVPDEPGRVRLTVELEAGGDVISGTARPERGSAVEFVGWLELMSVLEAATASVDARSRAPRTINYEEES